MLNVFTQVRRHLEIPKSRKGQLLPLCRMKRANTSKEIYRQLRAMPWEHRHQENVPRDKLKELITATRS